MSKIGIIIGQEYKNRVAKKSFILLTFLMPVLFLAIIFVPVWLSQIEDSEVRSIAIVDQTGLYDSVFVDNDSYQYVYVSEDAEQLRSDGRSGYYTAIVVL